MLSGDLCIPYALKMLFRVTCLTIEISLVNTKNIQLTRRYTSNQIPELLLVYLFHFDEEIIDKVLRIVNVQAYLMFPYFLHNITS